MASNSLLTSKYFKNLYVNRLEAINIAGKKIEADDIEADDIEADNIVFYQDTSIPLLWRLLSLIDPATNQPMSIVMKKNQQFINPDGSHKGDDMNHLTWTQYESTHFFSNKSSFAGQPWWEKLFQMTGAMIPSYSVICPGVAIFAGILTGYTNEIIKKGDYRITEPTPDGSLVLTDKLSPIPTNSDIVSLAYLQMSNIVQRILTLESQLGLDSRLENIIYIEQPSFSDKYSLAPGFFIASELGVELMRSRYNFNGGSDKVYYDSYINWKAFVTDVYKAFELAKELDKTCPFKYSDPKTFPSGAYSSGGIGQAFLLIVLGHWNNLLAAVGLLELAPDLAGMVHGSPQDPNDPNAKQYYLKPVPGSSPENSGEWFLKTTELLNDPKFFAPLPPELGAGSPWYSGLNSFLPVFAGFGYLNSKVAENIDGWLAEEKVFYVDPTNFKSNSDTKVTTSNKVGY